MDFMNKNGVTIYLKVSPEKLAERLLATELIKRPLLANKSENEVKELIEEKLNERSMHYESAQFVCSADAPLEEFLGSLLSYFERFVPFGSK